METKVKQTRRSYCATEKTALLEAYKTSGLSSKQWCKENGIGLSTLQRWVQKEWNLENAPPLQTWVSVNTIAETKSDRLQVQIGPFTVAVASNTNLKLFASVLKVMKELC
ncbi:IS66 family insertion sequence element accessory protein TnpA [Sporomusa sp.]|uniref:IS66 family insertion sequence element accessory protein TnpA n=1 Tax=Sporomusa sp. TaxID=2078658 RepID=UPI002CC6AB46|nr:hypothetical protein [Sporomusa sp.]HWR06661.1 hypothetical protein [Sporomusa sp.]HWR43400.1 hypothetical protein [Sporomusa sp.]